MTRPVILLVVEPQSSAGQAGHHTRDHVLDQDNEGFRHQSRCSSDGVEVDARAVSRSSGRIARSCLKDEPERIEDTKQSAELGLWFPGLELVDPLAGHRSTRSQLGLAELQVVATASDGGR